MDIVFVLDYMGILFNRDGEVMDTYELPSPTTSEMVFLLNFIKEGL